MEEIDNYKSIATLLQRHYINENFYVYSHLSTIIGNNDEEAMVFTDDQGTEYTAMECTEQSFEIYPYAYTNPISLEEAYKKYGLEDHKDIKELLSLYKEDQEDYLYITYLAEDMKNHIMKFRISQLIRDTNGKKATLETRMKDLRREVTEENVLDVANLVVGIQEGIFTKEELNTMKKQLKDTKKELSNILKIIDTSANSNSKNLSSILTKIEEQRTQPIRTREELLQILGTEEKEDDILDVEALYKEITKTLIGQDEPIRRFLIETARLLMDDEKNGILLSGPPGCGKTELMKLFAQNVNRPFLTIDSTQLTMPGFVGKDIEEYLWELYEMCDRDIDKTENAIIYFDEIDKKGSANKDDISGQGVLNQLLKFLDGTIYKARESVYGFEGVDIDTSNMLVVAGGAFSDVYKAPINKHVGFNNDLREKEYKPTINDFVEKGMMTKEFMRRFPIQIKINKLTKEDMINILKKSKKSQTKHQIRNFEKIGVDLRFTEGALEDISEKAVKLDMGASGLDSVVTEATFKAFDYALSKRKEIDSITITKETIENNEDFKVKLKEQPKILKKTHLNK